MANFTWVITKAGDGFSIASTNNPWSLNFDQTPLAMLDAGTDDERYQFNAALNKVTVPSVGVNCFFNDTNLEGNLYTKKAPNYLQASPVDPSNTASRDDFTPWPYAVDIRQTIGGGETVPECFRLQANQRGDRITDGLTPQPDSSICNPTQKPTRDNCSLTSMNSHAYLAYLQKIATKWMDEEAGGAEKVLSRELGARVLQQRFLQNGPVDEEGTPDVFRSLFTLLKSEGQLKRKIEEKASLDWRAEKPLVDLFASTIPNQPSFLPRYGEIVFYLRPLPPYLQLRYDPSTQIFRIWDNNSSTYVSSPPKWLAGIVTQIPSILPTELDSADQDGNNPTTTGYRIQALLSPSSTQKYLSKHTYTPLPLIRPFFLHPSTLYCISPSAYHSSITNALTLSATVSLIDKYTFTGAWPNAAIHSRGIFISGEAYWIGDTAVLLPEQDPLLSAQEIAEIIHITDIVTSFHNLQPSNNTNNNNNNISITGKNDITGNTCTHITISLHGHVYTSNPAHNSLSRLPVPLAAYTSPMHGYGTWFHIDKAEDIWAAPFSRIMSRLYEKEAMDAWMPSSSSLLPSSSSFPSSQESDRIDISILGQTSQAIISTRSSSSSHAAARTRNQRNNTWFWGDHRAEALDLATVAGMDVGAHDEERRPGVWRDVLRVLDGRAGAVGVSGVKRRRVVDDDDDGGSGDGRTMKKKKKKMTRMEVMVPGDST
ncbi:MAG: hypothetical protein Q9185_000606 [Variospora sp. 1 TL-2023]